MSKIDKIKSRLKTNSNHFDRSRGGYCGAVERGMLRRSGSVKADRKRDIARQGGYPEHISLKQHYDMANHNGIGSNLAYGIVGDTWRVPPTIFDGDEDSDRRKKLPTDFEKAIDEQFERLHVWDRLKGLDKAQRPMRYGTLQYVTTGEPAGTKTNDKLVRLPTMDYLEELRVFHEAQMPVEIAGQDMMKPDYGQPITYSVRTNVAGATNEWESTGYTVHASRVMAFGEGALDGSIYGVPCNEGCFEALMDLSKVRMSGAEGIFQNASNKYINMLPPESTIADAELVIESQEDFDNELSRSMATVGTITNLQTIVSDPTHAWTIALNECAAHHSKPMTILIGHQTGERASGEDITTWNRVIMDRQEQVANAIIKKFIKELQDKFSFPKPTNGFMSIVWRDLNESTAEQQVDLARKRVETNKLAREARMDPVYDTEFIQSEAGAPIKSVIVDDLAGSEGDEDLAGE